MTRLKITADECRSCGACCVGGGVNDGKGWADCTKDDAARMSQHVRERLVPIRHGFHFTPAIGATPTKLDPVFGQVCAFLRGTPGKRCSCSIYKTRPSICAEYKPGGAGCRNARAMLELAH